MTTGDRGRHRSILVDGFRIDLSTRPGVAPPTSLASLARVVAATLRTAGAPTRSSVAIILSDDAELAELNERHLGHEGPTDVLSFPLLPPDTFRSGSASNGSASGQRAPGESVRFALPPRQRVHLGDVIVSVERAAEQAEAGRGGQTGEVRWSTADEVRLLVVHGVLHVCGWDHAEPDEERAMRTLEREVLATA